MSNLSKETLLELYKKMFTLRKFDEMCLALKMKDLIMDGFHPYSGEEACAVGVSYSLNTDDYVISNHRPQGHSIAKGSAPKACFAEMLGRRGGLSEGIGGPMQWIDYENNFYCGSIVGSGMTIAAGVSMAMKQQGKSTVCVCYFGDGASNTGSFHEAMNLASIWKLPVVYILENNQYGEAMPVREFVSANPISKRGQSYNIEGITIDGNDVELVASTVKEAIDKARTGIGPYFIECVTYRTKGHYGGDPEHTYRSKEEVNEWELKCPILRLQQKLLDLGVSQSEIDSIRNSVEDKLEQDKQWALAQPYPTLEQATANVMLPIEQ
jgi:TPP-dependent pyruvate/acetoin dehydrogenase alpha subunit